MFDTMTMTKVLGGVCGTLLVFLLGKWAAEEIYHPGGHGDHEQAYVIPVEGAEDAAPVEEGPDFAEVYAMADAAAGEGQWRACAACHKLEPGVNSTGPALYGVVGRAVGGVADFGSYSGALNDAADVWTPENLNAFLENPRGFAPGTGMTYNGMRKIEDRANLIAYLDSLDG
ncbi:c-type cytochrome [Octadecabacter sp. 1_MG-2023]|uniref:c-type cytochrome n=1 Tax=unclassified Octadecabacter TaxID=196158 RepID=UPI001C0827BE|nr:MULTISPECIES: c-type cytochrome [unclassified Octadecabacter]MBU2994236.1 c-type cytochrome [Octadecabacter sp. B2R22]MDO6734475.1 c-type cytochrome [Octadecabacter sp. 1_MG-2023]